MANVLDLRRRIRSVRSTRQITKAMKMVSAAKLRRAQDRALAARPYAQMLNNVLKSLVSRADIYDPETGQPKHPLLIRRPENRVLLIVLTGDKGLAGAFNTNILKAAHRFIEEKAGKTIDIISVGRKAREYYRRRYPVVKRGEERAGEVQVLGEQVDYLSHMDFAEANRVAGVIIDAYTKEEIDSVYLIYNEFKSVISQRLVVEQVLPIEQVAETSLVHGEAPTDVERKRQLEAAATAGVSPRAPDTREIDRRAAEFATAQVDYIYEQSPEDLFRSLLPKYVSVQLLRAALESVAAEHAARMTAMDAATNNANDMIDSLTLVMNRVRQASITKEIIEIVSGAAAL
jgi:F-type H+-transporting ATPase subunit gamma